MRRVLRPIVFVSVAWLGSGAVVSWAQDTGAMSNGNWETASIWTGGAIPNSTNNVYIGSTYPTGAASSATVTMTANESAKNLYLGYGNSSSSGTLNLNTFETLTVGNVYIGQNGGTGTLGGGGALLAQSVNVYSGNNLTLGGNDFTNTLTLQGSSSATLTRTDSLTVDAGVFTGSTLNLSTAMSLNASSGILDVRDTGTVVNMNGNAISAADIYLGWYDGQAVTLDRGGAGGTLTAVSLRVGNESFNLLATDKVDAFFVTNGSTTLNSGVSVSTLGLTNNATAATTETGNITSQVLLTSGGILNLGANLNLSGNLTVNDASSVVNMNGYSINAALILLGAPSSQAGTLDRGGAGATLTATGLVVNNGTFSFVAGDTIAAVELTGKASVSTAAVGNITDDVSVATGSTLTLGANLSLTVPNSSLTTHGQLDVQDSGSTLNAQGHSITADTFLVGSNGTSAVTVTNLGQVTINTLEVGNGSALTLHGGDMVNSQITLTGSSVLTVEQTNGIGLTLNGTSLSNLTIDPSTMNLIFTSTSLDNWDFAWKDPSSGGNWVSTIDSMIANGQITANIPLSDMNVVDSNGYTYIRGISVASVPEPSSLMLACLATAGVAGGMTRRRRMSR
jgi:hypothetical protein